MVSHFRDIKLHCFRVYTISKACSKGGSKYSTVTAVCCCTGTTWMLVKFERPTRLSTCSCTSFRIMLWYKLSYRLTVPSSHPTELTHTQWALPVCRIWINSPITWLKFLTGPKVGLWKPSTSGLMFLRQTCTSWIISQSSQPLGDEINW